MQLKHSKLKEKLILICALSFARFSLLFYIQDPPSSSQPAGSSATTASSSTKLGTFRRMLNAIRYCFTKRGRSKKPDWLLDKQPHHHRSRSKSIPSEDVPSDASTANILCSHLSVDPSLPSHYRVSYLMRTN